MTLAHLQLPTDVLRIVVLHLHPCGFSLQRLRMTCKFMHWWLAFVGRRRNVYRAYFEMVHRGHVKLTPQSLHCESNGWRRYVGVDVETAYYGNACIRGLEQLVSGTAVYLPGLKMVQEYDAAVGAFEMEHHELFAWLAPFQQGCKPGHLQTKAQLLEHGIAEEFSSKRGATTELRLKPTCMCFGSCFASTLELKFMRRVPSETTHALVRIDGFTYPAGPVPPDALPCQVEELSPRAQKRAIIGHVVITSRDAIGALARPGALPRIQVVPCRK